MKSYEYYVYLDDIKNKIEKIAEPNRLVSPGSLSEAWQKLAYLDPEHDRTQQEYELVLKYVKNLQIRESIVAITPGFKTSYFCSFLQTAYNNRVAGNDPQKGNDSYFDIIYAYQHGIVALACNDDQNPNGHDGLADRMGIPGGDEREQYMVGGGIKFEKGKLITSELSGHYGHLWTDELRQGVCDLIAAATGLEVKHRVWKKPVSFTSVKTPDEPQIQASVSNIQASFFHVKKSGNQPVMTQEKENTASLCVLL